MAVWMRVKNICCFCWGGCCVWCQCVHLIIFFYLLTMLTLSAGRWSDQGLRQLPLAQVQATRLKELPEHFPSLCSLAPVKHSVSSSCGIHPLGVKTLRALSTDWFDFNWELVLFSFFFVLPQTISLTRTHTHTHSCTYTQTLCLSLSLMFSSLFGYTQTLCLSLSLMFTSLFGYWKCDVGVLGLFFFSFFCRSIYEVGVGGTCSLTMIVNIIWSIVHFSVVHFSLGIIVCA